MGSTKYGPWAMGPGGSGIIIIVELRQTCHFPIPKLKPHVKFWVTCQVTGLLDKPLSSLHVLIGLFLFFSSALTQQLVSIMIARSVAHCGNSTANQMGSSKHRGPPYPMIYHAFSSFVSIKTASLVSHSYPQLQR